MQDNENEWNEANDIAEQNHQRRYHDQEFLSVALFSYAVLTLKPGQSIHNSILTRRLRVEEYLNSNLVRMFDRIRMTPNVFTVLYTCLKERNLLEDSRGVSVEEQVFIFLSIMAHGQNNRAIKDDF